MNPSLLRGFSGSSVVVGHVGFGEAANLGAIILIAVVLAAAAEPPGVRGRVLKQDLARVGHLTIVPVENTTRLETILTDPTQHPRVA